MIPRVSDRKIVAYGLSPQADVQGVDLAFDSAGVRFDVTITDRKSENRRAIAGLKLPMHGPHNVRNAPGRHRRRQRNGFGRCRRFARLLARFPA